MKIALIGATGTIGQRIRDEALARGHEVVALIRDTSRVPAGNPKLQAKKVDALDTAALVEAARGSDVIISSYSPPTGETGKVLDATRALLAAASELGTRVIVIGGAGSLEVAPGKQLVDTPDFHEAWKPVALAHRDALAIYRANTDADWTYMSPAALIQPGERTGKYRTGGDQLLTDEKGNSQISAEDFAVALLDEVEKPRFPRQRFTVAY